MDFELSDGQVMLKASARAFLERECPESHVRAMEDDGDGFSQPLWEAMAQLGWHGIAVPERYGGAGLGVVELAFLVEEMGRVLLPGPFVANALCGAVLTSAGTEEQRLRYLPGLAAGQAIHTPASLGEASEWQPDASGLQARPTGKGVALTGTKLFVPCAGSADYLHAWAGDEGGTLVVAVVSQGAPGMTPRKLATIARDHQYAVNFETVEVDREDLIAVDTATARRWTNLAATLECAYLLGLAERSLELAVAYAKERRQFGQPIGAFQAVQHRAANMRIDVDGMRVVTYRASWSIDADDPEEDNAVAVAKAFCSDASRRVVGHAQQIHGGVGFTREYPAQLYFRRQKRGEIAWGDAAYHRERLAELLKPRAD